MVAATRKLFGFMHAHRLVPFSLSLTFSLILSFPPVLSLLLYRRTTSHESGSPVGISRRIPVRKLHSLAYVTFQSRCTGTLPLCFMRFRHARNSEEAPRRPPRPYFHDITATTEIVLILPPPLNLRDAGRIRRRGIRGC